MARFTINGTLSANVANGATFTAAYPQGTNRGTYTGAVQHGLSINDLSLTVFNQFLVTFNASNITVTNRTSSTWLAGQTFTLSLEVPGVRDIRDVNGKTPILRANSMRFVQVNLGSPAAASANAIATSQAVSAGAAFALNGALLVGGRVRLDVPRNVVAAWTGTSVITVTGLDEYGNRVVESSASGTTFASKKAFAEILSVTSSASITAATVGTGAVLGLPLFVESAGLLFRELMDGAVPSNGTLVVGDTAVPTALTGDVRGTYTAATAPDGSRSYQLWFGIADPAYRGPNQFAG